MVRERGTKIIISIWKDSQMQTTEKTDHFHIPGVVYVRHILAELVHVSLLDSQHKIISFLEMHCDAALNIALSTVSSGRDELHVGDFLAHG
jgi:hypothetical protein